MIVKVQRPLGSSEGDPPALVYDRDRTLHRLMPMSPEVETALAGANKVFCEASIVGGELRLGRRVADPGW